MLPALAIEAQLETQLLPAEQAGWPRTSAMGCRPGAGAAVRLLWGIPAIVS